MSLSKFWKEAIAWTAAGGHAAAHSSIGGGVPTINTLAAPSGASLIGTTGGGNLQSALVALATGQASGLIGYATVAAMNADLAHSAGTVALVTNDPTSSNNTYYIKNGISGSGSWSSSGTSAFALQSVLNTIAIQQPEELFAFGIKVLAAITDSNNRTLAVWGQDGLLRGKLGLTNSTGNISVSFNYLNGETTIDTPQMDLETVQQYVNSNPAIMALTDSSGSVFLAMLQNGQTYIPNLTTDSLTAGGITNSYATSLHSSDFVIYGDSLSMPGGGTGFSAAFATLYPSRNIYIQGVSGQQTFDIAARVGMGVTCTVTGGVIPTSGTVSITGWNDPNTVYGPIGSAASGVYSANANLYGVPGVLSVNASNVYSFTPTVYPTAARTVPAACPLVITGQVVYGTTTTTGSLTLSVQNTCIGILWMGRNDFKYSGYNATTSLAHVASAYAQMKNIYKRVIVIGTITGESDLTSVHSTVGTSPSDTESQRRLDANLAFRTALATTYGDDYLGMEEALEVLGYSNTWSIGTGTYQVLNQTLLPDGTHPIGNLSIVAGIVQAKITAKEW